MRGNFSKVFSLLGRLAVRWLECLGENPPLSRDHGIHAWRYLHPPRRSRPASPRPMARPPARHLYLVPAEGPRSDHAILPLLAEEGDRARRPSARRSIDSAP